MSLLHRRILATSGAAVLAAAAVLVATASPALAIANPLVVTGASAVGSPPSAFAAATCPPGWSLVGAGGRIVGAPDAVTMTDVIPVVATRTVTVWGNEAGAGTGLNWAVEAIAICDPIIVGVIRVGVASAFNGAVAKSVTAACPAATMLTGVGYELVNGNGDVFPDQVVPGPGLGGATVSAVNNGGAGNWSLTGYALCAPLPAGAAPVRVASAFGVNAAPAKAISPNCPIGTRAVGVGGQTVGAAGNAILNQLEPNPAATWITAGADAYNGFAGNWNLIGYAVCW